VTADVLTPYRFDTRYPGDLPELNLEAARAALDQAAKVRGRFAGRSEGTCLRRRPRADLVQKKGVAASGFFAGIITITGPSTVYTRGRR